VERNNQSHEVYEALRDALALHEKESPPADLISRAASFLLDVILVSLACSAFQQAFETVWSGLVYLFPVLESIPTQGTLFFLGTAKSAILFLYLFWTVSQLGGTPGKLLLGLKVIDKNTGKNLSLERVLLRELLVKPLFILSGAWLLWPVRKDKDPLHDRWVHSTVRRIRGGLG
jgi:uncharacterized RDD family membrane protein YckC